MQLLFETLRILNHCRAINSDQCRAPLSKTLLKYPSSRFESISLAAPPAIPISPLVGGGLRFSARRPPPRPESATPRVRDISCTRDCRSTCSRKDRRSSGTFGAVHPNSAWVGRRDRGSFSGSCSSCFPTPRLRVGLELRTPPSAVPPAVRPRRGFGPSRRPPSPPISRPNGTRPTKRARATNCSLMGPCVIERRPRGRPSTSTAKPARSPGSRPATEPRRRVACGLRRDRSARASLCLDRVATDPCAPQ